MRKKWSFALLVAIFLAVVFLWTAVLPIKAQGDSGISQKLSEILQNQKEIITRLGQMSVEINKVKIRVSSR